MSFYNEPALSYVLAICPPSIPRARDFIEILQQCITLTRYVDNIHTSGAITDGALSRIRNRLETVHDITLDWNPLRDMDSKGKEPLIDETLKNIIEHDIRHNPPPTLNLPLGNHIISAIAYQMF